MRRIACLAKTIAISLLLCTSCTSLTAERQPRCGKRWEKEVTRSLYRGEFEQLYGVLLPCAESGHTEAQYFLGILIGKERADDLGIEWAGREEKALGWLKKSAKGGSTDAMYILSNAYMNEWYGLPKNADLEDCWLSAAGGDKEVEECLQMERELGESK